MTAHRPVWLFSLDSNRYADAFPLVSGGLKSHFVKHGRTAATTDVRIVHFASHLDAPLWSMTAWAEDEIERATRAVRDGVRPAVGLSCYTWNTDELLNLARIMRERVPELLVVAGGPQVQRAEDYLRDGAVDVVVLGEGELTFVELLDATLRLDAPLSGALPSIGGIAWRDAAGGVCRTAARERVKDLDLLESPLDVVPLRDPSGAPLYRRASYETSRGCPYRCAFCEWGTGAIGTKMFEHSIERIRADLERLVEAGVEEVFFCDSNFGSLRSDAAKAELLVDLRARFGRPVMFCTSWSKAHNDRVQEIVRILHAAGLIEHYTLALETLTPRALQASNRTNLPMYRFQRIVEQMAGEGIPITTELIWALPGDNLADFAKNLDTITAIFPSSSLYGYTLLPGTEFFERREEYAIVIETLREVGNWKLDYVVASHTFTREEGAQGYFLITAHNVLNRGNLIPLTSRYVALDGRVSVSRLLEEVLLAVLRSKADDGGRAGFDGVQIYADRDRIYRRLLEEGPRTFDRLRQEVGAALTRLAPELPDLRDRVLKVMRIDEVLRPGSEEAARLSRHTFDFDAAAVHGELRRMRLPAEAMFRDGAPSELRVYRPAGAADGLARGALAADTVRGHHAVVP